MKNWTKGLTGKHIYKLYSELKHPVNKKNYIVYPDALIILQAKGQQHSKYRRLYFLEIDRGTMDLGRIQNKVIG